MSVKPFRRSVVLLVVLTLVALAPSSMAAAGPLAARPVVERGAGAARPVTGLWSFMFALAQHVASIAAAGTVGGGTTPLPSADPDRSGAILDPNGAD